jgi:hypothetical protein
VQTEVGLPPPPLRMAVPFPRPAELSDTESSDSTVPRGTPCMSP